MLVVEYDREDFDEVWVGVWGVFEGERLFAVFPGLEAGMLPPEDEEGEFKSEERKLATLFLEGSGSNIGSPVAVVVVLHVQVDILRRRPDDDCSGVLFFAWRDKVKNSL